ncbi:MAG: hypothetical protein LBS96_10175 [Oscillospiraceae bacterium]|jgi:ribosomal protein L7Ae-like RNA K-turn-binding protein|nr:hypothetical protein [Oscillospiraceae bacterium]
MMRDEAKLLSLLGLCRKANLAGFGHDAAKKALRDKRARLCLLGSEASPRLREEFRALTAEANVPLLELALTAAQIKQAAQVPAGVITINEKGLARKIFDCAQEPGEA